MIASQLKMAHRMNLVATVPRTSEDPCKAAAEAIGGWHLTHGFRMEFDGRNVIQRKTGEMYTPDPYYARPVPTPVVETGILVVEKHQVKIYSYRGPATRGLTEETLEKIKKAV